MSRPRLQALRRRLGLALYMLALRTSPEVAARIEGIVALEIVARLELAHALGVQIDAAERAARQ
jgi:hypothetical protein